MLALGRVHGEEDGGPVPWFFFSPGLWDSRLSPTHHPNVARGRARVPSRLFTKVLLLLLYVYSAHALLLTLPLVVAFALMGVALARLFPWCACLCPPSFTPGPKTGGRTKGAQGHVMGGDDGARLSYLNTGGWGGKGIHTRVVLA